MKCLDNVQKTWPRDGILRVQISQNSTVRVTVGNTMSNDINDIDRLKNETLSDDMPIYENISHSFKNQSNLELFNSIPEDKPSLNLKPKRETFLYSHDSTFDGKSITVYHLSFYIRITISTA